MSSQHIEKEMADHLASRFLRHPAEDTGVGALRAEIAALREEIADLRKALPTTSSVIITGPAVAEAWQALADNPMWAPCR